jgi:hypothetical protein
VRGRVRWRIGDDQNGRVTVTPALRGDQLHDDDARSFFEEPAMLTRLQLISLALGAVVLDAVAAAPTAAADPMPGFSFDPTKLRIAWIPAWNIGSARPRS